jgi:hypothetical protein
VRAADTLVLLVFVAVELIVGVYAVTRVVGPIQFYLVQWISAVGFLLWLAIGSAVLAWARAHATGFPRWLPRAAMLVLVGVLCVGAVRAFPGDAGLVNEDLDVPNNRALFGYVPTAQLLRVTRPGETVTLRLDSVTAWEVMAADALLLVQNGRHVKVVDTPVTRLLFDDSLRIDRTSGDRVLAFRDRPEPELGPSATLVADQGEWAIVDVRR